MAGTVLVLALESDLHADAVVHELRRIGAPVVRIDPTLDHSRPIHVSIRSARDASYEFADGRSLNFNHVTGVLCRFAIDQLTPADTSPLGRFAGAEEIAAFLAPLRAIPSSNWINDPWMEARSDCRILQAYEAEALGLSSPSFLVSSRYNDLNAFAASHREGCIIKPLSDASLARVQGTFVDPAELRTEDFSAPYTADFGTLPATLAGQVDGTPSLVQRRIHKQWDVRATVIDGEVFAAAMPVADDAPVDFRRSIKIVPQPIELPEYTRRALAQLVSRLNLRFASCDLLIDADGQLHFLEANVSGNWLWTELGAHLPISRHIARALLRERIDIQDSHPEIAAAHR